MKFLWVTDPWETLDHSRDSTLRLIEESTLPSSAPLGIQSYWCDYKTIRIEDNRVQLDAKQVLGCSTERDSGSFQFSQSSTYEPSFFDRILYRTDPPVDLKYLHPLQLLALGAHSHPQTEFVNPVELLALGNEKLEALLMKELLPPTTVSSSWEVLLKFGKKEGRAVLKPLHQAQSKGVELLEFDTPEAIERSRQQIQKLTENFETPVLLQKFLPEISQGEQRLWFIDGDLLACARKIPKEGQFRINMDQGGRVIATSLSAQEAKAAITIGESLKKRKIRLAAVDLIEGLVTDANFTSPGLLLQMEKIANQNLAQTILKSLVQSASKIGNN